MNTDPIADYLTRVRNAIKANHRVVEIPASNLKKEITKVLFDKGYIANFKFEEVGPQGIIKVALKYHPITKIPAIRSINRISKPGLRKYAGSTNLPRVLNGLGIAIYRYQYLYRLFSHQATLQIRYPMLIQIPIKW